MTVAERDELLDAVEQVERELEADADAIGVRRLVFLLTDLVARVVRVWLVSEARPS